jgi:hypothetical protein
MEILNYKVAIVGAGNLGRRYLEGLLKTKLEIEVYLIEINESALLLAKEVYNSSQNFKIKFHTSTSVSILPNYLDLAIISTTSNNRHLILEKILEKAAVKYWLLEKVLSNSIENLNQIDYLINEKSKSKAWVNTFFRTLDWFKEIKNCLNFETIKMQVTGGDWGIACNTVHFIDFVEWLTNENLITIDTSELEKKWFASKRNGYFEINGTLNLSFSNGTVLNLISDNSMDDLKITISYEDYELIIFWEQGIAKSNLGQEFLGKVKYQSEMTTTLVEKILLHGISELPQLQSSLVIHKQFIQSMIKHWNLVNNESIDLIPIT